MAEPTITLALQDYDHTRALVDGSVPVEGFALKVVTLSPPSQIFLRMLNQEEFDASEMSLSNYMIALGHGDNFCGDSCVSVPGVSPFLYLGEY
jgi:4,5-dihydroxyphthalate decarboxylase